MIGIALTDRDGDVALDLDLTLPARGITGLIAPAGAGKTLFLEAVAGFRRPLAGRITLRGRVLFDHEAGIDLPAASRRIGHVDREGLLFPHMSVRRNLRYGLPADAGLRARFDAIVAAAGLTPLLDLRPDRLSLSERQCAALARALLAAPDLLLLDAPLEALAAADRPRTLARFARTLGAAGTPVIYASRAAEEIRALCARAVILRDGQARWDSAISPVPADPMTEQSPVRPARFATLSNAASMIGCPPWN